MATSATAPTPTPAWRNRIVGAGEEAPDQLLANPGNWRVHPKAQQDALAGALDEVGWVQLTPPEIVAYLRSLPALWADSGPDARQAITLAIFARTDVMGFERMEYELTSDAIALGLDAALPAVFELRDQIGEFGRGERI